MVAKYVSKNLLTSKHLGQTAPEAPEHDAGKQKTGQEAKAEIDSIVQREHHAIRGKAEERNLEEVCRRRREVEEKIEQFMHEMEKTETSIRKEIEFCREIHRKLQAYPENITAENAGELRRLVREADLELLKKERGENKFADLSGGAGQAAPLTEIDFLHLTRIGIGLTWPLIAALIIAAAIVSLALLAVFRV